MRKLFYLFLLVLISNTVLGQITFNLRQNLGYSAFYYSSVVPVDSGYYFTALANSSSVQPGRTRALFCFNDLNGQPVWDSVYFGEGNTSMSAHQGTLLKKNDTTFVTVGAEFYGNNRTCFFNFHSSGDTNYINKFWSPQDTGSITRGDALCLTNDGGFLVGSSNQPNSNSDSKILIRKLDSLGNEKWYNYYGSSTNLDYREQWPILKRYRDNYLLLARHYEGLWSTTSNYKMQHQFWVLDSVGNILQSYTTPIIKPNSSNTRWQLYSPKDIIRSSDGGWIVATGIGTEYITNPFNEVYYNTYIYKLDSNFNFIWDKIITGQTPARDITASKVLELKDSSILLFGRIIEQDIIKGVVAKLDPMGNLLWKRIYSNINNQADAHTIYDVKPTPDGGYILCGEVIGLVSNIPQSGWLLKLDSMGCLVPGCHLVSTTRLPDNEQIDLKIYPNPATDYINLYLPRIEGTQNLHLHLYNLQGQLLQNHPLPQSDMTYMLSTAGLSSGAYVVQVLDEKGKILGAEKVIVRQ